ncbi:MAG: glycine/betaine/sarcosine/D-proline family reductase selenoprotein B [Burkholderiales bacterium]|nr:glycine/betaine/sarcosine/D-proline family reductase selenoprotein B [Burkholderiales bacterium]
MRIVHYLNQFFAGVGAEDRADTPPHSRPGSVGPGRLLDRSLGPGGEIVGTVICGDGRFADAMDETAREVLRLVAEFRPDALVAGPAFNAGRYGIACSRVCAGAARLLGIPAVTGMYPENAGADLERGAVVIVPTTATAAGMSAALAAMARLVLKLARGEPLGPAAAEGYLPRGERRNTRVEASASARALDLLRKRLGGEAFSTEVPLPRYEVVPPPAPVADPARVRVALVTEGGLVPTGNPGRLEWVRASRWLKYGVAGKDRLEKGDYEVVHGGYDAAFTLDDPNRLVPLDAARELARGGEIGSLLDTYYVTCGNHGVLAEMAACSKAIAAELREQEVGAVLLVAT